MNLISQLEETLHKASANPWDKDLRLQGWRVLVHESEAVSLGLKDNVSGSVYAPPSYRLGESGEVFLVWDDGRCSRGKVHNALSAGNFWQDKLKEWRQGSYEDPDGAVIPNPQPLPLVAVEDLKVQKILKGDDSILFDQVKHVIQEKPSDSKVQGNFQAAWGYRHLRTSSGLAITYQESYYTFWYSFDRLVSAGYAKRRLPAAQEWEGLWTRTHQYYEALTLKAEAAWPGTVVVFAPAVVAEMLEQFVLPNLDGQSVLDGHSAFRREEFRGGRRVFDRRVSLVIDPLKPLAWGSYLVTGEGIPAQRTELVTAGVLTSPYLRLKDARRWGGEPTGLAQGSEGAYLAPSEEERWPEVLQDIEDGVLVLSVLGLHTQDPVSGNYSLSAPQSIRIKKGRLAGKADVKLTGSFFKDLASPESRYARSPLADQPYMLVRTGVNQL
ncbi:MAG: metallopeptidase TldD-related protein [Desulfitobacteriaceae bacterium]